MSTFDTPPAYDQHAFIAKVGEAYDKTVADLFVAHTTGFLRNYVKDNGFAGVVIGISGGVDSAVVAALACRAIGPDKVRGIFMPAACTGNVSETYAEALAANLGFELIKAPFENLAEAAEGLLSSVKGVTSDSITYQNVVARCRATILMAHSNKDNLLVLNTGNKTEDLLGYFTLYGDSIGAFTLIGTLIKTDVWALALHLREIPVGIVERTPTAELTVGQSDEADLGFPYPLLDAAILDYCRLYKPSAPYNVAHTMFFTNHAFSRLLDGLPNTPPTSAISARIKRAEWKRKFAAVPVIVNLGDGYASV